MHLQAVVCPKCGCAVDEVKNNAKKQNVPANKTLVVFVNLLFALSMLVCVAFSIYSLVIAIHLSYQVLAGVPSAGETYFFYCLLMGLQLAPLLWMVPMMIYFNKSVKQNIEVGVAFKVCTFIFVNIIAGIILFCTSYGDKSKSAKDMKSFAKYLTVNAFFGLSVLFVVIFVISNLIININGGMRFIGFVVTILLPLVYLLWTIPMIVSYNKNYKFNQNISKGFKVCTLLFVSLIAGIILLNDKSYQNNYVIADN